MMRRELIVGLGALALARPVAAAAQLPTVTTIGYLSSATEAAEANRLAATRIGLSSGGFVDGRNLAILFRYAEGRYDRLPGFAADLVARQVKLIIASGLPAALAAKSATATIPIVFRVAIDPVAFNLVASLGRPGGNLTGVTTLFDPLTPKRLELLHQLVPRAAIVGFLVNPLNPNVASHQRQAAAAAQALGLRLELMTAGTAAEIEPAFALGRQHGVGALLLGNDPLYLTQRAALVTAAARHAIPTMYWIRDFAAAGGLISYGPNFEHMAQQAGRYAAQILGGAKPADLPVVQPTKFELVINLKTARALGLAVPPLLLAQAGEVIE